MSRPELFESYPGSLREVAPYGPYRGVVGEPPQDGDTLSLWLSLGFDSYAYETIRLAGIDCPELGTTEGEEAAAYTRRLLPPGTPCVVVTQKTPRSHRETMSFTRYLAWLLLPGGRNAGREIYEAGYARLSDLAPLVPP